MVSWTPCESENERMSLCIWECKSERIWDLRVEMKNEDGDLSMKLFREKWVMRDKSKRDILKVEEACEYWVGR